MTTVLPRIAAGGLAVGVMFLCALAAAPSQNTTDHHPIAGDWRAGSIAAPPGSETLSTEIPLGTVDLRSDANFCGAQSMLADITSTTPPAAANDMPPGLISTMSSVRWNLPPGAVVIFYEDPPARGEQLVLWGKGQYPKMEPWNFNDKASRWAWFDVDGTGIVRPDGPTIAPPMGTETLAVALPEHTVQFFKDREYRSDMKQITPATSLKAGEVQRMPDGMDDALTSLRWNLPPGVIVLLHEDADGKKGRVAIWGKGQLSDLSQWDFNDKVSRWSWAYLGTRE